MSAVLMVHCPHCSNAFDLTQGWEDQDARRFIDLLTQLPPKAVRPTFKYLTTCFKPKAQALRWSKLLKLAQELVPMIKDAQIKRNGTRYVVPLEQWISKLQELVESPPPNLALPLKSHAYLLSILANQAEQTAAKVETNAEAVKRTGVRPAPVAAENSAPTLSYAELVTLAKKKEQERKASGIPDGMALDKESGELTKKPRSKPPSGWNPIGSLLDAPDSQKLASRADVDAALELLAKPTHKDTEQLNQRNDYDYD